MKNLLKCIFIIFLVAFIFGCDQPVDLANPVNPSEDVLGSKEDFVIPDIVNDTETYNYDRTIYSHYMDEIFDATKDFVSESIKSTITNSSRAAYVGLSNDDKWQGKMELYGTYAWNVPTNVYGTDYNTSNNKLVINGEDLGTLQNIIFYKDNEGHYTKGVFGYKGKLYYIYDKSQLSGFENCRYEVLSKTDPETPHNGNTATDEIILDRGDYDSDDTDFSDFRFWTWDRDLDGQFTKYGNLGYAYTIRNVPMLDGSYATVTISCYNYWFYGFRVWIKEQADDNAARIEYPDTVYTPPLYEPLNDLEEHLKTDNYDFIYKVMNSSTTDNLEVKQILSSGDVKNLDRSIITYITKKTLAPGESFEFKYNCNDLTSTYNYSKLHLGCFFKLGNKGECGTWSIGVGNYLKGQQYTEKLKILILLRRQTGTLTMKPTGLNWNCRMMETLS